MRTCLDTRKLHFPSKRTRHEVCSSSQPLGQGMEPIGGSTSYQCPPKPSCCSVPGPSLLTQKAHTFSSAPRQMLGLHSSLARRMPAALLRYSRPVTGKMLLYNLSKSCPDRQTSEYPDSLSAGVSKSSSYHFLGTGLFYILGTGKPVPLQLP